MSAHERNGGSTTSSTLIPDWKLNPDTQCKITLERLSIPVSNTGFCRKFDENVGERCETNFSSAYQTNKPGPRSPSIFSTHALYNSLFVLDALLPKILGSDEEKCELCQEYVQKLQNHIIQTHGGKNRRTRDFSVFKSEVCKKIYSKALEFIRHWDTDTHSEEIEVRNSDSEVEYFSNYESSVHVILNNENNDQFQESSEEALKLEPMLELEHNNHFFTIENNLKVEPVDIDIECSEDPLLNLPLSRIQIFGLSESSIIDDQSNVTDDLPPSLPPLTIIKSEYEGERQNCSNKCEICGKSFNCYWVLVKHKKIHTRDKSNKCDFCDKIFRTTSGLLIHLAEHTGEEIYKCETCGNCYPHKSTLNRHKLVHDGTQKRHKCDMCEKSYVELNKLTKHKLEHTFRKHKKIHLTQETVDIDVECQEDPLLYDESIELEQPLPITVIVPEYEREQVAGTATATTSSTAPQLTNTKYECESCGKICPSFSALSRHNNEHTGEKLYTCYICKESFLTPYRLKRHRLVHTGQKPSYKCETCGKSFCNYWILVKHKKTHTPDKSNECEFCHKCFSTTSSLLIHVSEHTGEKIHKCEICGNFYPHKSTLNRHMLEHSAQKQRYKCDMCEKSYVAFDKLAKHRLEHTGAELRFKCETCGKGFHYLSQFVEHKRSHVTPSSYKCGVCGKNVKNLRSLNSHMLTHRGKMHYTCETCGEGFGLPAQLKRHKLIHTG